MAIGKINSYEIKNHSFIITLEKIWVSFKNGLHY